MKIETNIKAFVSLFNEYCFENDQNVTIVNSSEAKEEIRIYFDTFDHRLDKEHYYLEFFNNRYLLKKVVDNKIEAACDGEFAEKKMLKDFDDESFLKIISPIITIRALLPKFKYKIIEQEYEIKTEDNTKNQRLKSYKVYDLNGNFILDYKNLEENSVIEECLLNNGFQTADFFLYDYLEMNSPEYPGKNWHRAKIQKLDFNSNLYCNIAEVLKSLRKFIFLNMENILKDTDTEFIHNYRVYIRQVRALVNYTESFFPKEAKKLKRILRQLFKKTNHLRDLDVFILKKEYISENLPESSFNKLYNQLLQEREAEFRNVLEYFKSDEFQCNIEQLKKIEKQIRDKGQKSKKTHLTKKFKKLIIEKYFEVFEYDKKVLKKQKILQIHALRIKIKELRYCIMFFSEFWDHKISNEILVLLKKQQDFLGEITDLNFWIIFWSDKIKTLENKEDINIIINRLREKSNELICNLIDNHRNIVSEVSKIFI